MNKPTAARVRAAYQMLGVVESAMERLGMDKVEPMRLSDAYRSILCQMNALAWTLGEPSGQRFEDMILDLAATSEQFGVTITNEKGEAMDMAKAMAGFYTQRKARK